MGANRKNEAIPTLSPNRADRQRVEEFTNDAPGKPHRPGRYICSTTSVPVDSWRDVVYEIFPGLTIERLDDQAMSARLKTCSFADSRVTDIMLPPGRVARRLPPGAREDIYHLALHVSGNIRYPQTGSDVVQEPGDLVLVDSALPFNVEIPWGVRLLVWDLPRDVLAPMLHAPECAVARRIRGADGLGAILGNYARALMMQVDQFDAITQRTLLIHLCGLAALALEARRGECESQRETYRAARRHQILAYGETHLRDPLLTAERAAHDLGMSRRWLHALFEESGKNFAAWVAHRRIEESYKRLHDPAYDYMSVAEIAFLEGFDSLSTFNRRFRGYYGITPRDVRRVRRQATPPSS